MEPVHDHVRYRYLPAQEILEQRQGYLHAERLRNGDGNELGTCRVAQQTLHALQRGFPFGDEQVEAVRAAIPAEHLPQAAALGQQRLQHAEPSPNQFGHGQQAKGVAAGRRIHHDAVVAAGLHPGGDLEEGHQLIETGQGEAQEPIDVLIVQKSTGGGNLPQYRAVLLAECREVLLGVQLQHLQIAGGHMAGQTVPHGVGWVRRNQQ